MALAVVGLIAFAQWHVSRRPLDPRLFGKWEADHDHWSQQSCLLWLEFQPDGTVQETWDHIGELSSGGRRWFVDNDQLVMHEIECDDRKTWDGVRHNARVLWNGFLGIPLGVSRYRIRAIGDSSLELEPTDDGRRDQPAVLKFHRGSML